MAGSAGLRLSTCVAAINCCTVLQNSVDIFKFSALWGLLGTYMIRENRILLKAAWGCEECCIFINRLIKLGPLFSDFDLFNRYYGIISAQIWLFMQLLLKICNRMANIVELHINAHIKFGENPLRFTEMKIQTCGRQMTLS